MDTKSLFLITTWVTIYFLPTIVAVARLSIDKQAMRWSRFWGIFSNNLLFGWTIVGWCLAMLDASRRYSPPIRSKNPPQENLRIAIAWVLDRNKSRLRDFKIRDSTLHVSWNITHGVLVKPGGPPQFANHVEDIESILNAVAKHGSAVVYSHLHLCGWWPITNDYGEIEDSILVEATYNRETVGRIQWDNQFDIYKIADQQTFHESIR